MADSAPPGDPSHLGPAPPPPGEPTLRSVDTKTTTRIWGTDPYAVAVALTQHMWTAAQDKNAPGENDNVPDRPWGLVLVTPDDPIAAISAVSLIHFPDDAPILYVTSSGIPQVTLDEIKRLDVTGMVPNKNVDVIVVGNAANPGVLKQLDQLNLKHYEIFAFAPPAVLELGNATGFDFELQDRGSKGHGGGGATSGATTGTASTAATGAATTGTTTPTSVVANTPTRVAATGAQHISYRY